jgi:hypothetical protein
MGQNPGRHLQTPDVIRADSANPTSSGGLRSSAMKELRERIQREREVKSIYFDIVSFIDFDIISFIESIVPFEFFVWSPDVLVFSGPHSMFASVLSSVRARNIACVCLWKKCWRFFLGCLAWYSNINVLDCKHNLISFWNSLARILEFTMSCLRVCEYAPSATARAGGPAKHS